MRLRGAYSQDKMPAGAPTILTDGAVDFSGGVDSVSVTTVATQANQNGLARNELAWLSNSGVRDGGITPRSGYVLKGRVSDGSKLYQGGFMYAPVSNNPYLILSIGGHILKVVPDFFAAPIDLSTFFGLINPASAPHAYFCQGEQFLVMQAGDNQTLPLFWDDNTLSRSLGITNNAIAVPAPGINQIPPATAMTYFMGRIWYAQGRSYSAGDMVGSHNSGTAQYSYRDSILNVTESPLCFGGDGFSVPAESGSIQALFYNANLNSVLGQGQLLIGTRKAIYTLAVPVTRADWINTTSTNQPQQTVVQLNNGPVNDRSLVLVNGDVLYQTLVPGINSLAAATRDFAQWGNRDISSNEFRVLQANNRALLNYASGILFDNRMIQTALPLQKPQGVVHQALLPLDFVPISNFGANFNYSAVTNPIWEGMWEGLDVLQLFTGDFGGLERAFALAVSRVDGGIDLYELTTNVQNDSNAKGQSRIIWQVEFPSFNFGGEWDLKKAVSLELWLDNIYGKVDFTVDYRPDGDTCWHPWYQWQLEVGTSTPTPMFPLTYPPTPSQQSYQSTITLPKPPDEGGRIEHRPINQGYQFQPRLTVRGYCRLRGLTIHAEPINRQLYSNIPKVL
jgi:hypothetical protein